MKATIPTLAALGFLGAAALLAPADAAPKAPLPLVLYGEAGKGSTAFVPSGYEGTPSAIKMDPNSTQSPHSGRTCLKVQFTAPGNWGGVVWQSPANDWGDKPGGLNLSGARALSFWARGAQGGEVVSFQFGVLHGKPHSDTGTGKLDKVTLSKAWKQYTIPVKGQNLSDIKTGFAWVVAGQGRPVTFFLDDIQYR